MMKETPGGLKTMRTKPLRLYLFPSVFSVRAKILFSVLLINLIFVLGGAITLFRFARTVRLHQRMMDEFSYSVHHADRLLSTLLEMDDIYLRRRKLGKPLTAAHIDAGLKKVTDEIEILKHTQLDSIEKERLFRIDRNVQEYSKLLRSDLPESLRGWQDLLMDTDQVLDDIKADIGAFLDINRSQLEANERVLGRFYAESFRIAVAVLIVSLVLAVTISAFIISTVIRPIRRLIAWLEDYRSRPGESLSPLEPLRADEIGYLTETFNDLVQELVHEKDELRRQTITDELTGLYNYRYFQLHLQRELSSMERHGRRLALAIVDIDHFKHYNDANGHQLGNIVLKDVADILKSHVRDSDFAGRYGGEEFVLVFPETDAPEAQRLCERIRRAVESADFPRGHDQPLGRLTVSVGLAFYPDSAATIKLLVEKADRALYQAKANGRNCVVSDRPSSSLSGKN